MSETEKSMEIDLKTLMEEHEPIKTIDVAKFEGIL